MKEVGLMAKFVTKKWFNFYWVLLK